MISDQLSRNHCNLDYCCYYLLFVGEGGMRIGDRQSGWVYIVESIKDLRMSDCCVCQEPVCI